MKLRAFCSQARSEAAFTMAEIAIALGVIAFALVAIIGILPVGLQTQRDNREETIVVEDARVLIEAIRNGPRDTASDIGAFVERVDGTNYGMADPPQFLETTNLIKLLSDTNEHEIVLSSFSGSVATRGHDLGFRYSVRNTIRPAAMVTNFLANSFDFRNTLLSNQMHEVRLRFVWPVRLDGSIDVSAEFNRYVARTLISGRETNGYFYAQHFQQPIPMLQTNLP
jgi:type II secretory pathway pseudopilin PulG